MNQHQTQDLDNYIKSLIHDRSIEPKDDLISELIQNQVDGDALSSDELIAMVEALLLAGTDTTRNQLGATIAVLADHPEQYSILRERKSLQSYLGMTSPEKSLSSKGHCRGGRGQKEPL